MCCKGMKKRRLFIVMIRLKWPCALAEVPQKRKHWPHLKSITVAHDIVWYCINLTACRCPIFWPCLAVSAPKKNLDFSSLSLISPSRLLFRWLLLLSGGSASSSVILRRRNFSLGYKIVDLYDHRCQLDESNIKNDKNTNESSETLLNTLCGPAKWCNAEVLYFNNFMWMFSYENVSHLIM